jgi:cyclic pyranopterin phosphate synthase
LAVKNATTRCAALESVTDNMENKGTDHGLTHFDQSGSAIMVDVTKKSSTHRVAVAKGKIKVNAETLQAIVSGTAKKGDVLGVARIAGIMAAKKTPELIPLCHPLMITKCTVDFSIDPDKREVQAVCTVKVTGQTGVEMEALTGVSAALLTIYDMCKAIDKGMELTDIHLSSKSGGKSGDYVNQNQE